MRSEAVTNSIVVSYELPTFNGGRPDSKEALIGVRTALGSPAPEGFSKPAYVGWKSLLTSYAGEMLSSSQGRAYDNHGSPPIRRDQGLIKGKPNASLLSRAIKITARPFPAEVRAQAQLRHGSAHLSIPEGFVPELINIGREYV
jgi:hypothetical protein